MCIHMLEKASWTPPEMPCSYAWVLQLCIYIYIYIYMLLLPVTVPMYASQAGSCAVAHDITAVVCALLVGSSMNIKHFSAVLAETILN